MCGVAGAYQQQDGKQLVSVMNGAMAHRGPDACGLVEAVKPDSAAVLGHRRLSIIDLSVASDQPFTKGDLTLSYNGEVYNFRELRSELAAHGATFNTTSDTEVVLEAWRMWGRAALPRLRGMFAFAIHDASDGRLVLARDPLGIKPLYLRRRGEGVVFASELKALVAALGDELTVDPAGLVASMLFYWVPPHFNALSGTTKLAAGTWMEFSPDGTVSSGEFWNAAEAASEAAAGEPADLREVIEESVRAHLISDVPVATFLSGGLDSSIVAALACREARGFEAYTIGFREQDHRLEAMPDDLHYARKVAASLGIPLHEIMIDPDIVSLLPQMVDTLDEPIGDPAAINTLLMCEAARDAGVKVLLSGMGADELFGGYRKHLACLIGSRYRQLPALARTAVRGAVNRMPVIVKGRGVRSVRWAQRFISFAELSEEEAFRRSYTLYDQEGLTSLLSPALAGTIDEILTQHRDVYLDNQLDDHVSRMCLADTRLFMPGLNLTYTDRASMAASTEVRVPFVDPMVFSAAFSFPGKDKIRGREQKAVLKDAARAWLPDEIIDRPKASFGAPLRAWVTHDLTNLIDDVLLSGELISSGVLSESGTRHLVQQQRTGRRDESKQIWQLLSLELWYRNALSAGVGAL